MIPILLKFVLDPRHGMSSLKCTSNFVSVFISFSLNNNIYLFIFIVVQVNLSPFSPHPSSPPTLKPATFGFVHVSFIHVP